LSGVAASGADKSDKTLGAKASQPAARGAENNPAIAGGAGQRHISFKVRLKERKPGHGLRELPFRQAGERDGSAVPSMAPPP
jgi:hypothetical protein